MLYLLQPGGVDEGHEDGVAILGDGVRNRETGGVESGLEEEFFGGG